MLKLPRFISALALGAQLRLIHEFQIPEPGEEVRRKFDQGGVTVSGIAPTLRWLGESSRCYAWAVVGLNNIHRDDVSASSGLQFMYQRNLYVRLTKM